MLLSLKILLLPSLPPKYLPPHQMGHLGVIIITAMIPPAVPHISELNRWSRGSAGSFFYLTNVYLQHVLTLCGEQSRGFRHCPHSSRDYQSSEACLLYPLSTRHCLNVLGAGSHQPPQSSLALPSSVTVQIFQPGLPRGAE